jgi:hypothetical protein
MTIFDFFDWAKDVLKIQFSEIMSIKSRGYVDKNTLFTSNTPFFMGGCFCIFYFLYVLFVEWAAEKNLKYRRKRPATPAYSDNEGGSEI